MVLARIPAEKLAAFPGSTQRVFKPRVRRLKELGFVHTVRANTHDQAPPHAAYIPTSGGIFRDCAVHDFDVLQVVNELRAAKAEAIAVNLREMMLLEVPDRRAAPNRPGERCRSSARPVL